MNFLIKKEDFLNGIKIVEKATIINGIQPVLGNILIETVDKNTIKLSATSLDLTIETDVTAQIIKEGSITLPARTLSEIISKVDDKLITLNLEENNLVKISCQNSLFEIIGIDAEQFPTNYRIINLKDFEPVEIEVKPLLKSIRLAGFASASFEQNNLLSGVVCDISESLLEMASTDGNRLARYREKIDNKNSLNKMIIPSKTLNEFLKISSLLDEDKIQIYNLDSRFIIKTSKTMILSRLLEGLYPKYNQLIPQQSPKEAIVNTNSLIKALERVSVLVNEKTNIVKFEFSEGKLVLKGDTPESGKAQDEIDIEYSEGDLVIAFNYKYVLESLKMMETNEVKIGLNTNLSATIFKPNNEEDFICLVMPVQVR